MDENMLLNFAVNLGEIMLKNGAETHRVEDTVERILSVGSERMPETFVTPTGIFASVHGELTGTKTKFKRISTSELNLEKITMANSLSRRFVERKITLQEGFDELLKIEELKPFNRNLVIPCYGIACFSFSQLLNGTFLDSTISFMVGVLIGFFLEKKILGNLSLFLSRLLAAAFNTCIILILYNLGIGNNYDSAIIGSIMPLVPGVSITNSIRDIMNGDFLSGAARLLEAFSTAIAIAVGVGFVISGFTTLGVI